MKLARKVSVEVENERHPIALVVNKSPAVSIFIHALDEVGGSVNRLCICGKKKQKSRDLLSEG